jgi:hypothetical protein
VLPEPRPFGRVVEPGEDLTLTHDHAFFDDDVYDLPGDFLRDRGPATSCHISGGIEYGRSRVAGRRLTYGRHRHCEGSVARKPPPRTRPGQRGKDEDNNYEPGTSHARV